MSSVDETSPFGAPPGRRSRIVRLAIYGALLVAAIVAAVLATRTREQQTEGGAIDHSSHGAAAGDVESAVTLSPGEAQRIGVTYATVTPGLVEREVRTVGQVTYDETRVRAISPKIDGWVESLHVNYTGQFVARGAPLMTVHSPMLVMAQEELLLAKRLAADVAGGTGDAARGADELVASARRRLSFWGVDAEEIAAIEGTGQVRRALTLRSPVSGFVVEKNVVEGQRIMAGEALYRVADLSVVWLEGAVFEQDLAAARVGQAVTATFEALPGQEWKGRIAYVYPALDAQTRTARVRVELSNSGLRLKPGMYATFRFRGRGRPNALTVPRSAVLATGERTLVFVRRGDGKLEPREVAVGATSEDRIEVLRGLAAGETVVASATFLVDAESNLGSALGGMGNMPGMDMTAPVSGGTGASRPPKE